MNPQMFPTWQNMPTYQLFPPTNSFQVQIHWQQMAALQYNAASMQPGSGAVIMPHVPLLIPQLDQQQTLSAGWHQDRAHQPERGRHKTAASSKYHISHASFGTIANDQRAISHHSQVGDVNNARSGSAGRPPSLRMSATPNHRSRSRAALQNRSRRASTIRSQRRCDELSQYVVAISGAESERPWKRRRSGSEPTAVSSTSPISASASTLVIDETETTASTNAPRDEVEQQDIPMGESEGAKLWN